MASGKLARRKNGQFVRAQNVVRAAVRRGKPLARRAARRAAPLASTALPRLLAFGGGFGLGKATAMAAANGTELPTVADMPPGLLYGAGLALLPAMIPGLGRVRKVAAHLGDGMLGAAGYEMGLGKQPGDSLEGDDWQTGMVGGETDYATGIVSGEGDLASSGGWAGVP